MAKKRISSWTIRNTITPEKEIWLHGYTGAVDIIDKPIIDKPSLAIQDQMLHRGYMTEMSEEEEGRHFESLCDEIRKVKHRSMLYVLQFALECNFACSYCFENNHRKIPKLRDARIGNEHLDKIEKVIISLRKNRIIEEEEIILFGGEPILLANRNILENTIKLYKNLTIKKIKVITNGYHIDEMIDIFDKNNAKFQITLDGTEEVHDKRRFDKNTGRSFDKIINNISMLIERGFAVEIRINIDHRNYRNIPKLFEYFASKGLSSREEFQPYLAYIQNYGKYDQRIEPFEIYEHYKAEPIFKEFNIGLDPLGLQQMLKKVIIDGEPFAFTINHCGANKGTMITFSPDGLIHPCWDSNSKDIPIGTYFPKISWDEKYYQNEWLTRDITNISVCKKCKYALFCGGGCQYLSKLKEGNFFRPHCSGFQSAFDIALKSIGESLQ